MFFKSIKHNAEGRDDPKLVRSIIGHRFTNGVMQPDKSGYVRDVSIGETVVFSTDTPNRVHDPLTGRHFDLPLSLRIIVDGDIVFDSFQPLEYYNRLVTQQKLSDVASEFGLTPEEMHERLMEMDKPEPEESPRTYRVGVDGVTIGEFEGDTPEEALQNCIDSLWVDG